LCAGFHAIGVDAMAYDNVIAIKRIGENVRHTPRCRGYNGGALGRKDVDPEVFFTRLKIFRGGFVEFIAKGWSIRGKVDVSRSTACFRTAPNAAVAVF
jgi:hypothetical protein